MKVASLFARAFGLSLVMSFVQIGVAEEASQPPAAPSYTVTCKFIDRTNEDGKPRIVAPSKVSVFGGKPAQILNQVWRPFVVAVSPVAGDEAAHQPLIVVLNEGFTMELCVNANGSESVTVDVSFEEQKIDRVDIKDVVPGKVSVQSPRQRSTRQRIFELAKLGQPTSIALDDKSLKESKHVLEFVVTQDKP